MKIHVGQFTSKWQCRGFATAFYSPQAARVASCCVCRPLARIVIPTSLRHLRSSKVAALKREFEISTLAVVVLVLLRIGIGWHFLHEGVWKAEQPNFSAKPYLQQSKGPLANWYRALIADVYGDERLDIDRMWEHWNRRIDEAEKHFDYSDGQKKAAKKALATRLDGLDDF